MNLYFNLSDFGYYLHILSLACAHLVLSSLTYLEQDILYKTSHFELAIPVIMYYYT